MQKRRTAEEWMLLVEDFKASTLKITAWCRKNEVCKGSFYPYLKKSEAIADPLVQKWGTIALPKGIEESLISLKIGTITLDIKSGFDKETLSDILNVVMKL